MNSSAMCRSSSSVRGRRRFRASWTVAQTAAACSVVRRVNHGPASGRARAHGRPAADRRPVSPSGMTLSASAVRNDSGRKAGSVPLPGVLLVGHCHVGRLEEREQRRELGAQLGPVDDPVDEAVVEQELRALEAVGQLAADRAGLDPRPGEADERVRLGQVDVAERGERGEHAAGRRVAHDRDERHAGHPQPLGGGHGLGQLHQGERALLHPGATRRPTRRRAGSASRGRPRRPG